MIGSLDQRYEIQKGTEETTYEGTVWTWTTQTTIFGKEIEANAKVREQFQSLASEVTSILKLNGKPDLDFADYRLKRVSDGQLFKPTAPPVSKGQFNKTTEVGVKRASEDDF